MKKTIQAKLIIEQEMIESKILFMRGKKVMLDRDLAKFYGVETKVLNQSVKRNIDRFPDDFLFQLSREECKIWRSQFVISNKSETASLRSQNVTLKRGQHRKHLPYAFTRERRRNAFQRSQQPTGYSSQHPNHADIH